MGFVVFAINQNVPFGFYREHVVRTLEPKTFLSISSYENLEQQYNIVISESSDEHQDTIYSSKSYIMLWCVTVSCVEF